MQQPASALAIAQAVRSGHVDASDVVAAALARIAIDNPALNAIVTVDPDRSLAEAAALTRRLKAGERPALAGVPIVIKDAIWAEGWRATQGSRLYADFVAPASSLSIDRLRRAGAIVVGVANMSEFGCKGVTSNPLYGVTRHPIDLRLTPGGSSGGCASALAAGLVPLALGTDGGGSARRPAAHTGVVGFKPSGGVVAHGPGFPGSASLTSVIAPMGRCVADVAAMFEAILGPDPSEALTCALPAPILKPSEQLTIAYARTFGLGGPVDPDVAEAIEAAVTRLRAAGLQIVEVDPLWPAGACEAALMPMQWAGLAQRHGAAWRTDPDRFDPDIGAQIERGLGLTARDVLAAQGMASDIMQSAARFFHSGIDMVIGPTSPCLAWPHRQLGPDTIAGVAVDDRAHAAFTPFFNHGLCAAISMPVPSERSRLPIGLQIAGPRFSDRQILALAHVAEAVLATPTAHRRSAS
ncbi:amidase [Lichenihabitans sp. PAMC28606]|uniref:amidase n=1 Tax=Lichenihabitans sp. PAMC28606 TaxID=2880932 RepID=UPI001D0B77A0|nr:amidase [Lichenihabitans sp. PAMC28606]UDL95995.1 amidase [Lichenihabitans sp. PAMC28606]